MPRIRENSLLLPIEEGRYKLTFRRLIGLLAGGVAEYTDSVPWIKYQGNQAVPDPLDKNYDIVPGDIIKIASQQLFMALSGVGKSTVYHIYNAYKALDRDGKWPNHPHPPNFREDFYIKIDFTLKAFVDNGCPLIDPEDPEKRPIVFNDIELENGQVLKGWQQIQLLFYEERLPDTEYLDPILLSHFVAKDKRGLQAIEDEPEGATNLRKLFRSNPTARFDTLEGLDVAFGIPIDLVEKIANEELLTRMLSPKAKGEETVKSAKKSPDRAKIEKHNSTFQGSQVAEQEKIPTLSEFVREAMAYAGLNPDSSIDIDEASRGVRIGTTIKEEHYTLLKKIFTGEVQSLDPQYTENDEENGKVDLVPQLTRAINRMLEDADKSDRITPEQVHRLNSGLGFSGYVNNKELEDEEEGGSAKKACKPAIVRLIKEEGKGRGKKK